jgi:hypothetical protein
MKLRTTCLLPLLFAMVANLASAEAFRVTTLRAAPGQLDALISQVNTYRGEQRSRVLVMRHSQGDHWDLMLLEPAGDKMMAQPDFSGLANFQHTFYAESGVSFKGLQHQAKAATLYHIEMFEALAGQREALIDQRRRENQYLANTGQVVNVVFTTLVGSDVDVFTLGFHKDWAAFGAGPAVSDSEAEVAAKAAGFKSRDDIGLYLRRLLSGHHDTLAVPVN